MITSSPQRLRGQQPSVGTWLSIGSPVIAELAAECGFDWVLFDLEHGCGSDATLLNNLQAVRGSGTIPIVRVGAPHPELILRVLDWGAEGVMVPHIESAPEAAACVEAMRYPPRGRRGFSRSGRVYGYGLRAPRDDAALPEPVFIAQIETLQAVRNAEPIASVDGVDMVFVGPADLGFDLRARRDPGAPSFEDCLGVVTAAARRVGKPAGILVRNLDDLPNLRAQGFTHFGIDSDVGALRGRFQAILNRATPLRETAVPASKR
ncbi:aldolase/citrate lyase family protein [Opitutus sp. ER46]|uniref:HpcH/HpaI aldolase family protein n=1 Tax=Opitutus sp. ER46 TaxID=2161864 RepID=UPI000D3011F6|nr:aldolase/citrate lyase family protein [Opitutus sp. ER46]PTX91525.1 hypothetical protein DB354_16710 [Opitutus sp. ER46]